MEKNLQYLVAVREGHRKILTSHLCRAECEDITTEVLTLLIEKISEKFTTLKELDESILPQTKIDSIAQEMLQTEEIMLDVELRLKNLRMRLQKAHSQSATMLQPADAPVSKEDSVPADTIQKLEQKLMDQSISKKTPELTEVDEKSIQETVDQLEATLAEKGINGLKAKLHEHSESWKKIPIIIAVTGRSGAGKSSFVNAFLGLSLDDDNAAKVGAKETTRDLKVFYNTKRPNLMLWDMPGVGTPLHPKENYLENVQFDKYDFFFLLSRERFTSEDLWLAKEIKKRHKKFYFIRTCIDNDIASSVRQKKT